MDRESVFQRRDIGVFYTVISKVREHLQLIVRGVCPVDLDRDVLILL